METKWFDGEWSYEFSDDFKYEFKDGVFVIVHTVNDDKFECGGTFSLTGEEIEFNPYSEEMKPWKQKYAVLENDCFELYRNEGEDFVIGKFHRV
jgi:hypothetical protein